MKLIVGLGNPGEIYVQTRHNVGFLFVDYLAQPFGLDLVSFRLEAKFQAQISQVKTESGPILLAKPQTYMNTSGLAVRKILDFYKVTAEESLILIHDDLDIAFGEFKLQFGKGPRTHNGVDSVVSQVSTSEFWRVRIGIAGETYNLVKQQGGSMKEDYVLKSFSNSEQTQLSSVFARVYHRLDQEILLSGKELQ